MIYCRVVCAVAVAEVLPCCCVMAVIWGFTCIAWVWVVSDRLLVIGFVYHARAPGPGLQAQALCPPTRARGPLALALRLVYDGLFVYSVSHCFHSKGIRSVAEGSRTRTPP